MAVLTKGHLNYPGGLSTWYPSEVQPIVLMKRNGIHTSAVSLKLSSSSKSSSAGKDSWILAMLMFGLANLIKTSKLDPSWNFPIL